MNLQYKKLWLVLCLSSLLLNCSGKEEFFKTEVTGKGNGGNSLSLSQKETKALLTNIKAELQKIFTSLKFLVDAEELIPGSTDLSEFPEVKDLVSKMIYPEKTVDIFKDLESKGNIRIQDESCLDSKNYQNIGVSVPGDVSGSICLSISELRKISIKGAEAVAQIQALSIAAHEFGHHFLTGPNHDHDERVLQTLQAFINYELHRFKDLENDNLISNTERPYVDQWLNHSELLFEQVKAAQQLGRNQEVTNEKE